MNKISKAKMLGDPKRVNDIIKFIENIKRFKV